ncbi:hypothetical protein PAPHI01_2612 [Pancytospora philotis]|nr:hypothetical protein PAPHI01_2612 [Pancytospora philotis]
MDVIRALTLLLTVIFILFNAQGSALSKDVEDRPKSNLPATLSPLLLESLREAAFREHSRKQDLKICDMLFKCRYKDQPEASECEQNKGSPAILHGVCNPKLYKDEKRRHGHRHERHSGIADEGRDAEVAVPLAPVDDSEIADHEHGKALHRALSNTRPTFSNYLSRIANTTSPSSGQEFSLALIYESMAYRKVSPVDDGEPSLMVMPTGRYFFESAHFRDFLTHWQHNTGNADFHISQSDLDSIQELAKNGVAYQHLSRYNKRRVAKLIFVRNGLETYGLMKAARSALGFEFDERKTADNFLRAVYAYLMAVDGSEGRLKVAAPVSTWILTAEMFSIAYARCSKRKEYVSSKDPTSPGFIEMGHHIFDKSNLYITNMIMLFQAWDESSGNAIDPVVLENVIERIEEFIKLFRGSYKDGCQLSNQ